MKIIEAFKVQEHGVPKELGVPNFTILKETLHRYIHLLQKGKITDDDFKQEIFIAALESVFGNELWKWVDAHTRTRRPL